MNYIQASDIKYYESGFLAINLTGGTSSTNGRAIIGLNNVSLSYQNNTADVATFDLNFNILKVNTTSEWFISASGLYLNVSGESYSIHSGNTRVHGGISSKELLGAVKAKLATCHVWLKIADNHFEHGNVVVNSFEITAGAPGEPLEFSLELTGSGALTTTNA